MSETVAIKPAAKVPNPIDIQVGARLRMRRMLISMSQEKLGDSVGLTFQQIQKYEKGTNRIGASRLQQISSVLGVPVAYFFEDSETEAQAGFAENQQAPFVHDVLGSSEGLALNKYFLRVKDPKVRRKIIDLVKSLADEQGD